MVAIPGGFRGVGWTLLRPEMSGVRPSRDERPDCFGVANILLHSTRDQLRLLEVLRMREVTWSKMASRTIYFAGSIRAGRDDAELYAKIVGLLQKYGRVLTEHVGDPNLKESGISGKIAEIVQKCRHAIDSMEEPY